MARSKKFRALILDDEPPFERLFPLLMALLDWECEVATHRQDALERLKSDPFDAIIVDYYMPEGNGLHFIVCLRRDGIDVPAILTSGDPKVLDLVQKDLLKVRAVLLKPFTAHELRAALAAIQEPAN